MLEEGEICGYFIDLQCFQKVKVNKFIAFLFSSFITVNTHRSVRFTSLYITLACFLVTELLR